MFCDKLYNHRDSNYVEAFGNVHVIQNDTLNLWGRFYAIQWQYGICQSQG